MELTWPLAWMLVIAVIPAVWLARRAAGRRTTHPLWFLGAQHAAAPPRRGARRRTRWLLVAALALCGLAAGGPLARGRGGSRVLVVDLSAPRVRDVAAVRARLAAFDEAVLVAPGAKPRRLDARTASDALVPSRDFIDAAELAAGVAAASPNASRIEIAAAPPVGANARIRAARFHRDPVAARRGQIVVEIDLDGDAVLPPAVIARAGTVERARAAPVRVGDRAVAIMPFSGAGDEQLTLVLAGAPDAVPLDDELSIRVPSLAPAAVWLEPTLATRPIARALSVLPTVSLLPAPRPDAIAVVTSSAWQGAARARLIVVAPPPAAPLEPLLSVPGSPLLGATPALLAAVGSIPIAPDTDVDPAAVWLRAGPHAAVWHDVIGGAPALHVAAAIEGPLLPIVLADAFAAPPLAAPSQAGERAPGVSVVPPAAPPGTADHRNGWPIRVLLAGAALLVACEVMLTRRRRAALAWRAALVAGLLVLAWRGVVRDGRRVVFVVDVSESVATAQPIIRAAVERRASALGPGDRAAVVLVAGGARTVVPLGPPQTVATWARSKLDPTTLRLDRGRTDLAAALAVAGDVLAGAGGEIVLVGDGRDTVHGPSAVRDASALIGRGFELVAIDTGDLARVDTPVSTLLATRDHAFALPLSIETRIATAIDIAVSHRGRVIARRSVHVAAGTHAVVVPVELHDVEIAELDIAIIVAGDPIEATNHARARVEVHGGAGSTLRVGAAQIGALVPAALANVDTVVLDDIAGTVIDSAAVAALDAFVRGGGTLVWAAGPAVARDGLGVVERLLPLRTTGEARVAMMLVVDRSGSIAAAGADAPIPGAAELAAAARALAPTDLFGAIAFDVVATEWVTLGPVGARPRVPALPPARGGTDPTPALELAGARLANVPADARRVVVLVSDGGFPDAGTHAVEAAAALARQGARVEIVVAGAADAEARARLDAIAAAGGGRVHELATDLAAALPALRIVPAARAAPQRATFRDAFRTIVGAAPAPAAVSKHIAMHAASDAIVLADAGDDPLLAIRGHGAGRVLAWAADLGGAWIDAGLSATVIAAASAHEARIHVEAIAGEPPQIEVRAVFATDPAGVPEVHVLDRGFSRVTPLVPDAAGTYRAYFDAPASSIEIAEARTELVIPDPEHAAIGVARTIAGLARAQASHADRDRPWAALPAACAMAIVGVLWALGLAARALAFITRTPDS